MKKILFLIPAMITAGIIIGCNSDKTELSFTNDSADKINTIVWVEDGTTWQSDAGWDVNSNTGSKDVSATKSDIACSLWDGNAFKAATVQKIDGETISGEGTTIQKGASTNLTLTVVFQ